MEMDRELKTICSAEYVLAKERMLRHEAYNVAIQHLREFPKGEDETSDIKEVRLLVNDFYCGIEAQKELLYKCIELKWIKI